MTEKQKPKKEQKVISIEEIKEKSRGTLVEIPDWEPGQYITVRLRTIDVTPLIMETGAIPNELSVEVSSMFEDKEKQKSDLKGQEDYKMKIDKFIPTLEAIAKQSLAEPTYEEINEIYPLTMQQKIAIFKYVTGSIEQLKPFREES